MTFAGIDVDTTCVTVTRLELDTDRATYDVVRLDVAGDESYLQRVRRIRDLLPARQAWKDSGVTQIAVEKPMSNSFRGAVPLATVLGAVLSNLPRSLPVLTLEPHEWKLHSLGHGKPGQGNARKPAIAAWAHAQLLAAGINARAWPQNALDAYCIAYAARAIDTTATAAA